MSMLVLVAFLGLFLLRLGRPRGGVRDALVEAFLLLFLIIAVVTEVLSLADALTFPVLTVAWALVAGGTGVAVVRRGGGAHCRRALLAFRAQVAEGSGSVRLLMAFVALMLALTLLIALLSPPNNWDSMTYHLARVAAWIQHHNVAFYPTHIDRQNCPAPLAEFAILHLQVLSRSDLFAGLVQWAGLAVCILLASLAVRELGQPLQVQVFAGVAVATLPMAVLQGISTQNDVLCAAFCLGFAYFLWKLGWGGAHPENALFCGISLGLALLTKATAILFCAGIAVVIGLAAAIRLCRASWIRAAGAGGLILGLALAVNLGHAWRSYALYGRPVASGSLQYGNDTISAGGILANGVRNAALHLGVPWPEVNAATEKAVTTVLGRQANSPDTTWMGTRFRVVYARHEDLSGNLLHLALVSFALLAIPFIRRGHRNGAGLWAGAVIAGGLLFCALIKWQPWAGRLHTPLFVLAMPVVAVALAAGRSVRFPDRRVAIGGAVCFAASLPFLLYNQTRPLLGPGGTSVCVAPRAAQYFVSRPGLRAVYSAAVTAALDGNPGSVGLLLGSDDWEYPLWVLAGKHAVSRGPVFRHVNVTDASRALAPPQPLPDRIIATRPVDRAALERSGYRLLYAGNGVSVWTCEPHPSGPAP